jgi:hypothetical protein
MSARLLNKEIVNTIRMQDLKDGQLAEVMEERYLGIIIQRYLDSAVPIGKQAGYGWSSIQTNSLRVRVLEDSELIEIFNNE